jgi:transcription initiation factor TFIIIB Brf1 subunit/transcription initiation factor TFIIB
MKPPSGWKNSLDWIAAFWWEVNDPLWMGTDISKMEDRSILADLDKIPIGDEIKLQAEHIFKQLEVGTRRGGKRKKLLFYCIYNAYKALGILEDAKTVADLVGIPYTDITKAFSLFSEGKTSYRAPITFRTPSDFIQRYYSEAGLGAESLPALLALCEELLRLDPDLYESYPQVVAAGIILYYLTINGVAVNRTDFAKIFGKSPMTIAKMYKRVSAVHNA